jgi:hypothetical protein
MTKPPYRTRAVYRITTFVPLENLECLLEGIIRVVPLQYGKYDRVAWWSAVGTEQFRPLQGANPTVGSEGKIERVPSVRLEFTIPRYRALLERVLTVGLIPHHPWEEPVVFVDESLVTLSSSGEML